MIYEWRIYVKHKRHAAFVMFREKKRPTIGRSWEVLAEVCGENAIKRKKGGIDRWNAS